MRYSHVTAARPIKIGAVFEADQFRASDFPGTTMSPFVMVDHFRMYAPTFDEHPHAGISAVTLMLEDSTSEMLSIDSVSHFSRIGAGDLHWTRAGSGVSHNQMPAGESGVIHALQIFVNLPANLKDLPRDSFKVAADEIPTIADRGMRVRVVAGAFGGHVSPAPTPQPVMMLDVKAQSASQPFERNRHDHPISRLSVH